MPISGFYAVVPDASQAEAVLAGGASVVQLRAKQVSSRDLLSRARELRSLTRGRTLFIVNDRADIALLADADGVHLGQDDLPLLAARRIVGTRIIGISTHTLAQALEAEQGGADYIGFGPIFSTSTKDRPDPTTGVHRLAEVTQSVRIPVVAIGGITPHNVALVVQAGAAAAASIAGVLGNTDVVSRTRAIARAFSSCT